MPARGPYMIERVPGQARTLRVLCGEDDPPKEAVVTITEDGESWNATPVPITGVVADVFDVLEGAAEPGSTHGARYDDWRVETSVFSICWPEDFALQSLPGTTPPVFELVGPEESRITIQGPLPGSRLPRLQEMVAPGQTLLRVTRVEAGPMVEAAYSHEGEAWRQLHCVVRWPGKVEAPRRPLGATVRQWITGRRATEESVYVAVVTAQTPLTQVDPVRAAVEAIAASITPQA